MNRIQLLDEGHSKTRRKLSPRSRRRSKPQVVGHPSDPCFFVPLHYEPNYAYPLVVWLHGPDDDHRQLNQVMPHISMRNYVGVGVPMPSSECGPWTQSERGICEAFSAVDQCITQATERFNIAAHRVFLAGYDCGGSMALRLGLAAASRFAGAASMGGPVPVGHHPLSNLAEARSLSMLIAHGRDSESYPITRVCDELKLCHAAGISLNLRQYPSGHELTTKMLSDLDVWMMEIVTGVRSHQDAGDEAGRKSFHDN